jgi:anaerobic dimethyl sulfoxide reductase subunit B (iron-sulfur subunit)
MERWIVFFEKKCIGCHSCEVACQLQNHASPGDQLRSVNIWETGKFPKASQRRISRACFHCDDPSCVSACPVGALRRRTDGVVEHLIEKCIGCKYCLQACPFGVPKFSRSQQVMRKCSFCIERIDQGKEPACVSKCPTGALTYRDKGELTQDLQAYGKIERLHMVYTLESEPNKYKLPAQVPGNVVKRFQILKWLAGLLPGGFLLLWLWRRTAVSEAKNE